MSNYPLDTIRHSAAHVMAAAVQKLYPDATFDIGPATENGFYYDFDMEHRLVNEDLKEIEKQMKKLIDAMSNNPKQIVVNASQKLQQEQLFQQLLVHLRERFPKAQIAAHGVGPIHSHHLGRGAIGISWMEE